MRQIISVVVLFAALFCGAFQNVVNAEEKSGKAVSFAGNIGGSSMYFGGATGAKFADAVVQADVTIKHRSGFYVNLWGSRSIDPPTTGLDFGREYDIKIAKSGTLMKIGKEDITYDVWTALYDLDGPTDFYALGGSVTVPIAPKTAMYVELNRLLSTDTSVFGDDLARKVAILTKVGDYDIKAQVGGNKDYVAAAGLVKVSRTVELGSGVCATPSIGILTGLQNKAVDTSVYGGLCVSF
jgi:hypothetical protein